MALALPLQGMAAVARLHCGAAGLAAPALAHGALHGHDLDHATLHHATGHASHQGHPAQHHASPLNAGAVAEPSSDARAIDAPNLRPIQKPHASHGHACSACAACCAGLGLPAAIPLLTEPDLASVPAATVAAPAFHFLASGPERPPRSDLA